MLRRALNERLRPQQHWLSWVNFVLRRLRPRIERLDPGPRALRLTGLTARAQDDHDPDWIALDASLVVALRCQVAVTLTGLGLGFSLDRLSLLARLRLRLAPLLRDEKVFGQVRLSCFPLPPPTMDYALSGLLRPLCWAPVKALLLGATRRLLLQRQELVLPNPWLGNEDDWSDHLLSASRPAGVLRVKLVQGLGLGNTTTKGGCCFLPDPYVVLKMGSRTEKTKVRGMMDSLLCST